MSYTAQPIETVDTPTAIAGQTQSVGTPVIVGGVQAGVTSAPSVIGGVSGATLSAPTALPSVAIPEVEKPCAE